MKNVLLWSMLVVSIQAIDDNKYGFSPIRQEESHRYPDQDICEIIWDEELRDCTGFPEGEESPDNSPTDMQQLVSYEEKK